ncbi:3-oxoacyl-ACP reductase FabG [Alkaliphilus peptidifermentans]|uniref:3-oxoacyl-[acyl-carrier-protein] reductase n=1 Tax=Alkaliphilus peptidifermentans DSM 18978 TaxID=1120976 RepID=A0A1G5I404_9FIRM|nr:3-oxoacyl-ACP reductase FabG [Alkaliphilus peptidifermentans]SCY70561.1 3-oxoacyl-[acyl-carrier-protein] reductase [Alkaliphilus peptidifermentans DSM 18978]
MGLDNKVAIVSGGSRGIGREIVLSFAQSGANVVFTYFNSPDAAKGVEEAAKDLKGTVKAFHVDIRNADEVKELVKKVIDTWGTVDIVVNNAGISKDKTLPFMEHEEWKSVLETNIYGTFYLTQAAIAYLLKKKKGRIINISSISGISGIPGQTNYSASKAALLGFTRSLAKEVARYGISVNAIAPAGVETDMFRALSPKQKDTLLQNVPMGRLCSANEVADIALFLADDAMSPDYLTGATIVLDGGMGS